MERKSVCYAKKVLREMHPLYNLNIEICLPFLDPVIGVARRQGLIADPMAEEEERKGLAEADGLKDNRTDLEL
jgi:hypothetical protein